MELKLNSESDPNRYLRNYNTAAVTEFLAETKEGEENGEKLEARLD